MNKMLCRPLHRGMSRRDTLAIQRLFLGSEGGYWPADPAYAYEASTGTIKASGDGVVGLRLDVSKQLVLGPENVPGGIASLTAFNARSSLSIVDNVLTITCITTNGSFGVTFPNVIKGSSYIWLTVTTNTTGKTLRIDNSTFDASMPNIGALVHAPSGTGFILYLSGGVVGDSLTISLASMKQVLGNHAIQATTAKKPYLRRTPYSNKPWYDSNTATGALNVTFAGALGSACTIATVTPEGVSILDNQTVGTTYNICPSFGYNSDILIINRALTSPEKALVTRVMQRSLPTLGSNLAINGVFTTDADWIKGTGWSIDGTAAKSAGTASNLTQTLGVSGNQYRVIADITRTAGTVGAYNGTAQIGTTAATETAAKYAMKTTSTTVGFRADASFAGTVDNAVIQEIL